MENHRDSVSKTELEAEKARKMLKASGLHELDTNSSDDSDFDKLEEENENEFNASGQQASVKKLFEGPRQCPCCINWVEVAPKNIKPTVEEQTESKRHALLIRMKRNHDQEGKSLVLDSVVVQSPFLKTLLGEVFKDYDGITTHLKKLVFRAPFHPFFYEWKGLEDAVRRQTDEVSKAHARLLKRTLKSQLKDTMTMSKDLASNGVITFDYLWTIFKPGIDVFSAEAGPSQIYKLVNANYGVGDYRLLVRYIDYRWESFGYNHANLVIPHFSGTKPVTSLEAFPAAQHPFIDALRKTLRERGARFRDFHTQGHCYKAYKEQGPKNQQNIDGRIIVDPDAYAQFNSGDRIKLSPLNGTSFKSPIDVYDQTHIGPPPELNPSSSMVGSSGMPMHPMPPLPPMPMPMPMPMPSIFAPGMFPHDIPPPPVEVISKVSSHASRGARKKRAAVAHEWDGFSERSPVDSTGKASEKNPDLEIPDDLLYLCTSKVKGYCFKTKSWTTFCIDYIEDIKWNEKAFESLVLPGNHKRMILAFVESQILNKGVFDDVIEGKGKGIIMLLQGSPGVGKTLTAEALAERLHKPLYALSAAELGDSPTKVEDSLPMILEIAAKWDAVLLLDESDVFLEKRQADKLSRNSIVAIFLRLLEYYHGVMFMTTNRVHAMDPAFQSRIHLTINYPELNEAARRQIWTQFVHMSGHQYFFGDDDYDELAQLKLNGREIKNLIKTAQLLACYEHNPLTIEYIRTVMQVTQSIIE